MKHVIKLFSIIVVISVLQSCTKGFTNLNKDPTKPTTASTENLLTGVERKASDIIYSNYGNGKVGMLYAQYWSETQKEGDSQYQLDEGCNNNIWSLYSTALTNLDEIVRLSKQASTNTTNQVAIANILSVWLYQLLADIYGNIPYTSAMGGVSNLTPSYQDAKSIYDSLVQRLDAQIAAFDTTAPTFGPGDVIYSGNIAKWKKLANSLKLRIGIRMADAEPDKSKQIVENAYKSGVFASNADDAVFQYLATVPDQFPFNEQANPTPNDYQVSATLLNYLTVTNDPRLPIYARQRKAVGGGYVGKPYGIGDFSGGYDAYSYPGTAIYSATFPGIIMNYAEVEFALAEAAARGYNVGISAAQHYENGILANMAFWKIDTSTAISYLAQVPYDASNWKNIIGTQKWLALYNQGLQAWLERTRLNFSQPNGTALFVAPKVSLDNSVTMVPYRLTYPISESNNNNANYTAAGQAIGGDKKGTKLWWQKN